MQEVPSGTTRFVVRKWQSIRKSNRDSILILTRDREDVGDTLTADRILQNLAKRPNVQSTLILSRKDGSIIKATGSIANSTEADAQDGRIYSNTDSSGDEKVPRVTQGDNAEVKSTESTPSAAQVMAESIHAFVASASLLAESLGKLSNLADTARGRTEPDTSKSEGKDVITTSSTSQVDHEIQLLRLRLKKQEVIIFPDPHYLCCVVQDLEKVSR